MPRYSIEWISTCLAEPEGGMSGFKNKGAWITGLPSLRKGRARTHSSSTTALSSLRGKKRENSTHFTLLATNYYRKTIEASNYGHKFKLILI